MPDPKPPRAGNKGLGQFLTNFDQPIPLPRKLYLLTRNLSLRLVKRQTCCGHDGEPGC